MNKPKRHSINKLTGERVYRLMRLGSLYSNMITTKSKELRKNYGRPVKAKGRRGQPSPWTKHKKGGKK
jgi:hypothetical protein